MKKIYDVVKVAITAIALGETIASYYKNKEFRTKLNSAEGFDKAKVIFNNLLDINRKFFTEVLSFDYKIKYNEFKTNIESKINELNSRIDDIKSNINSYSEEKIKPILNDIYTKVNQFKEMIEDEVISLNERYKLEEKLNVLKDKISDLKSKIKK